MSIWFALFNLGGGEIVLILALILILFGARTLPNLAKGLGEQHGTAIEELMKALREVFERYVRLFTRGLGESLKEFRRAASENDGEISDEASPWASFGKRDVVNLITLLLLGVLAIVILSLFAR